jgi:hypothetical protein
MVHGPISFCTFVFLFQEDEFDGFTELEVTAAEEKRAELLRAMAPPPAIKMDKPKATSSKGKGKDDGEGRFRNLARKSYAEMIREGLAQPARMHKYDLERAKLESLKDLQKGKAGKKWKVPEDIADDGSTKLKSIKIRLTPEGKAKIVRGRGRPTIYEGVQKAKTLKRKPLGTILEKGLSKKEAKELKLKGNMAGKGDMKLKAGKDVKKGEQIVPKKNKAKKFPVKEVKKIDKKLKATKTCMPKSKKFDSARAKKLVAKAKIASKKSQDVTIPSVESSPEKRRSGSSSVFHLPAVSSRSARRIKPAKRFLEEDFSIRVTKKPRFDACVATVLAKNAGNGSGATIFGSNLPISPMSASALLAAGMDLSPGGTHIMSKEKQVGLLDRPLVVCGKRDRKPSQKLLQKISDGDFTGYEKSLVSDNESGAEADDEHTPVISSLSPYKQTGLSWLQTEHISPQPISEKSPNTSYRKELEEMCRKAALMQKSGSSVLQKPRLHLNRATINRSKVAVARSLKIQMKKAAEAEKNLQKLSCAVMPVMVEKSDAVPPSCVGESPAKEQPVAEDKKGLC